MDDKIAIKEPKAHGDAMLPLTVYHNKYTAKLSSNREVVYCHWHEEVEFVYFLKGNATFYINMEPVQISSGQAVLVNSEAIHSAKSPDDSDCDYYAIVFKFDMLSSHSFDSCQSKYIDPLLKKYYEFPLFVSGSLEWEKNILIQLQDLIHAYEEKKPGYELIIKASLYRIFACLFAEGQLVPRDKSSLWVNQYKVNQLKKVLNYIQDNYHKKIMIKELASVINMSPNHFCSFFKANTGRSPMDYIIQYRIDKAAAILAKEDRKIFDIAMDVGFENFSYFIKKFKEYKDCTPSNYRNQI